MGPRSEKNGGSLFFDTIFISFFSLYEGGDC